MNVLMITICAIHLSAPSSPHLTPLANRPLRLGKLSRGLRKKAPPHFRSAPPCRHRHRRILPPLRRPRRRLHAARVPRLRPRTPARLHLQRPPLLSCLSPTARPFHQRLDYHCGLPRSPSPAIRLHHPQSPARHLPQTPPAPHPPLPNRHRNSLRGLPLAPCSSQQKNAEPSLPSTPSAITSSIAPNAITPPNAISRSSPPPTSSPPPSFICHPKGSKPCAITAFILTNHAAKPRLSPTASSAHRNLPPISYLQFQISNPRSSSSPPHPKNPPVKCGLFGVILF